MKKRGYLALSLIVFCFALVGFSGKEAWAATTMSNTAKLSCTGCHGDFKSVLPKDHAQVGGQEIAACLTCHRPGSPDKAASNPFAARIHRPHTGPKAKMDCLVCHTWTPGKSFGLVKQKDSWGPLSRQEMELLKQTMASWSDSPYLDSLHARQDVTCSGCHAKRLPTTEDTVENDRCLSCHDSYEKLAEKTTSAQFPKRNPHQSHLVGLDCTKCHMAHGESKVYCLQCHSSFDMKIPGGPAAPPGTVK
ncbi:MAG: cytochrome c3 family protein [Deltaproteobacteria bacterium]|nr:cytochrome c3 family protein [Deltaproteobacteria bacterium]